MRNRRRFSSWYKATLALSCQIVYDVDMLRFIDAIIECLQVIIGVVVGLAILAAIGFAFIGLQSMAEMMTM
jgi:hypothetical protein